MSYKNVGQKIKECRLARCMTQEELGKKCGIPGSAIRRYESGRQTPKKETLHFIYEALGVHETISLGNPDGIPIENIIGSTEDSSEDSPEELDDETPPSYSMTTTQLNAKAYNVMVRTLHTCATKEEMMIVGYALDEFINEITGGKRERWRDAECLAWMWLIRISSWTCRRQLKTYIFIWVCGQTMMALFPHLKK